MDKEAQEEVIDSFINIFEKIQKIDNGFKHSAEYLRECEKSSSFSNLSISEKVMNSFIEMKKKERVIDRKKKKEYKAKLLLCLTIFVADMFIKYFSYEYKRQLELQREVFNIYSFVQIDSLYASIFLENGDFFENIMRNREVRNKIENSIEGNAIENPNKLGQAEEPMVDIGGCDEFLERMAMTDMLFNFKNLTREYLCKKHGILYTSSPWMLAKELYKSLLKKQMSIDKTLKDVEEIFKLNDLCTYLAPRSLVNEGILGDLMEKRNEWVNEVILQLKLEKNEEKKKLPIDELLRLIYKYKYVLLLDELVKIESPEENQWVSSELREEGPFEELRNIVANIRRVNQKNILISNIKQKAENEKLNMDRKVVQLLLSHKFDNDIEEERIIQAKRELNKKNIYKHLEDYAKLTYFVVNEMQMKEKIENLFVECVDSWNKKQDEQKQSSNAENSKNTTLEKNKYTTRACILRRSIKEGINVKEQEISSLTPQEIKENISISTEKLDEFARGHKHICFYIKDLPKTVQNYLYPGSPLLKFFKPLFDIEFAMKLCSKDLSIYKENLLQMFFFRVLETEANRIIDAEEVKKINLNDTKIFNNLKEYISACNKIANIKIKVEEQEKEKQNQEKKKQNQDKVTKPKKSFFPFDWFKKTEPQKEKQISKDVVSALKNEDKDTDKNVSKKDVISTDFVIRFINLCKILCSIDDIQETEGIFRVNSSLSIDNAYKKYIEEGKEIDVKELNKDHPEKILEICDVFKRCVKNIKEKVITKQLFYLFKDMVEGCKDTEKVNYKIGQMLLSTMEIKVIWLLKHIVYTLDEIARKGESLPGDKKTMNYTSIAQMIAMDLLSKDAPIGHIKDSFCLFELVYSLFSAVRNVFFADCPFFAQEEGKKVYLVINPKKESNPSQ